MINQEHFLRDHPSFQDMPVKIQEWILASSHATADFSEFFDKGGAIESDPDIKLGIYSPELRPKVLVNDAQWEALRQKDAPEYSQRHLFGLLAHEIGHDRYNTGNVPFTGNTEEAYVQYRAGLEAQAIFNAFSIFKDLEQHPDFKQALPYDSIGYLSGVELGAMYKQWRKGDDHAVVEAIAARVLDRPNTLGGSLPDQNGDGTLTQRDAYLRDFRESQLRRLQSPNPPGAMDTPGDARAPAAVTPAPEPPRPAQASLGTPAPSGPPVTPDFRNPHHPLHAHYQQALDAVEVMGEKHH
ncbi:MAG TPA: hypothetical protein VEY92_00005, partial [Pseudoxanthomonas sp.]|nr:hypothetical protein [Pseudoxanthomonas sp.]